MSVKNETLLLEQAVEDILCQSYPHFELIIVDDGSDYPVADTLSQHNHSKITILRNTTSIGQAASRNNAFKIAKGAFIAVADADDRYHPKRLEKQVDFLQQHPNIHLCGTNFNTLPAGKSWPIFTKPNLIRQAFILNNPLIHSSVMFRSELLSKGFFYDPAFNTAEDYELFSRFRNTLEYANLKEKLVTYRISERTGGTGVQQDLAIAIRKRNIQEEKLDASEKELQQLAGLFPGFTPFSFHQLLHSQSPKRPKALYTIVYSQYIQYTQKFGIKPNIRLLLNALYHAELSLIQKVRIIVKHFIS